MALKPENTKRLAEELGAVKTYGHFINGHWLDGHSGETIEPANPATRKTPAYHTFLPDLEPGPTKTSDAIQVFDRSGPPGQSFALFETSLRPRFRSRRGDWRNSDCGI